MIVVKQIKPARLKEDDMRLALLNGMRKFGTIVKKEYEKTVTTWNQKPKFDSIVSLAGGDLTLVTGVSGGGAGADHWRYVNEGTRPHVILPKGDYPLAFQSGYNAKTTPGLISSKAGGSYGDVVYARGVMHPGTEARNFDEVIGKEMEPRFKRAMEQTMRDVAKASGHGMR
jgi:hypothetical protein